MNFTLIIPLFLGIIRYKVLLCVLLIFSFSNLLEFIDIFTVKA